MTESIVGVFILIFNYLEYLAAQGKVIYNDDTGTKILSVIADLKANPNQRRTGTYTTGIVGFADEYQIMLFYAGKKHAGENLSHLIKHRQAHLSPIIHMCDALSMNLTHQDNVIVAHCLAHARRKFVEVERQFPQETDFVIAQIGLVYKHDKATKEQKLSNAQRLNYHQGQWHLADRPSRRINSNTIGDFSSTTCLPINGVTLINSTDSAGAEIRVFVVFKIRGMTCSLYCE
jgi:transposase